MEILDFFIYLSYFGKYGRYNLVSELVSHLSSDLRGVLRPVVGRNEDVAFFERG